MCQGHGRRPTPVAGSVFVRDWQAGGLADGGLPEQTASARRIGAVSPAWRRGLMPSLAAGLAVRSKRVLRLDAPEHLGPGRFPEQIPRVAVFGTVGLDLLCGPRSVAVSGVRRFWPKLVRLCSALCHFSPPADRSAGCSISTSPGALAGERMREPDAQCQRRIAASIQYQQLVGKNNGQHH